MSYKRAIETFVENKADMDQWEREMIIWFIMETFNKEKHQVYNSINNHIAGDKVSFLQYGDVKL